MSDADQRTEGSVEEGVTVEKELRADEFAVPSVVLSIRGPTGRAAVVRVLDPIPDGVDADEVGFHPKHGGEFWTFEGDHVAFERRFDPGEEYRTVYGFAVEPPGDGWSVGDPEVEVVGVDETESAGTTSRTALEAPDQDGSVPPDGDETNVLVRLAEELERGDPGDVRRVREALIDGAGTDPGRIDELRADVDELTESIDAIGGLRDGRDDDDRLARVSENLDALGERVSALEDRGQPGGDGSSAAVGLDELEAIRDELGELSATVDEVVAGKDRNARDIDDIGAKLRELTRTAESAAAGSTADGRGDERISELEQSAEAMRDDLDAVLDFKERLQSTLREYESGNS